MGPPTLVILVWQNGVMKEQGVLRVEKIKGKH